jgi:hypothetical protein
LQNLKAAEYQLSKYKTIVLNLLVMITIYRGIFMLYKMPCSECDKLFEIDLDIEGLDGGQLEDISKHGFVMLSKKQVQENQLESQLDEDDKRTLEENGEIEFPMKDIGTICDRCGSDQSYDRDGNNVTSDDCDDD